VNALPLIAYVLAGLAYAVHFARRAPSVGRAATTLLLFAALTHTFVIGMQTMEVRHVPFSNPSRAVSTFVWLLALSYLYLELTTDERAMGVFILPIIVVLQLIPAIFPGMETADPVLDSPWFWIHVLSLLFAYASLGLAGVLGLTYMLQFKEIKKKHLGYFYTRLPSLQILDVMNGRAVAIGWLLLTTGVIVGGVWAAQARAIAPNDPNIRAMAIDDPKILLAVLTWGLYSFAVFARQKMGWNGRRAAWLSTVGFVFAMLNFVPITYLVTTSHTFY
jgi:ABC-type transport system involved in cytochrome c biogenesis permease subunit